MSDWYKYRNWNTHAADCELVSAVNAHYYLYGRLIMEARYKRLMKMGEFDFDGAGNMKPVLEDLKLSKKPELPELPKIQYKSLPLECGVEHPSYGYHSVLVVDYEGRTNSLRVTGLSLDTTEDGWIYEENFKMYLNDCSTYVRRLANGLDER